MGASVQSTAGSRGVHISFSNAGYTTFGGGVRVLATHSIRQFPFHFPSHVSPCAARFRTSSTTSTSELFYTRDVAVDAKSRSPHRVCKPVVLKETLCLNRQKENIRNWRRRIVGHNSVFVWTKRRQTQSNFIVSAVAFDLSNTPLLQPIRNDITRHTSTNSSEAENISVYIGKFFPPLL